MDITEKAKKIRLELKKLGYSNRQVSVKSGYCGYSDSIHIYLKSFSVDADKIEKITNPFKSIDYDEKTQEILAGGNTYVSINWDFDFIESEKEKLARSGIANKIFEAEQYAVFLKEENKQFLKIGIDTLLFKLFDTETNSWNQKVFEYETIDGLKELLMRLLKKQFLTKEDLGLTE